MQSNSGPAAPAGTAVTTPSGSVPHLKFHSPDDFRQTLMRRTNEYFATTRRSQRDCPEMYFKSAVILTGCLASYALLVFVGPVWWLAVPLAALLGLASAAVGFNIQHDGGHGAFSNHRWSTRPPR